MRRIAPPFVAGLLLAGCGAALLLAACAARPPDRTARDDFRASCRNAARWHGLAADRTAAGQMAPATFVAIDDAYDQVVETCRRVLLGDQPATPAETDVVAAFGRGQEAKGPEDSQP